MLHLERVVSEIGRRIGKWVETHPSEPETRSLFTCFYPSRMGGDPFEGIFWSGALADSIGRFRQEQTGSEVGTSQPDK